MITNDPLLRAEEIRLTEAKTKVWNDRFAAESAAYPPTLKNILWIVAKSGYTKVVAPFMILSKATRECKNLQRVMREVMNRGGETQLHFFSWKGMTSSVKRMLEMKSIDVEARNGGEEDGDTCLITAIDAEACDDIEGRPLHSAATYGLISVVKELIEVRNADINARDNDGSTALRLVRDNDNAGLAAYLVSHGAIEYDDNNDDDEDVNDDNDDAPLALLDFADGE